MVGATVTVLPGTSSDAGTCEMMSLLSKVGAPPKPGDNSASNGGLDARDAKVQKAMSALQKKHLPKSMPRVYIFALGVSPEAQGRGVGSALMGWLCEVADVEGAAMWLETSGAGHEAFYARKGGFVAKEKTEVVAKGTKGGTDATMELIGMMRPSPSV